MNLHHFEQLVAEANRCLLCRNPRCQQHCPIATPIPEIITLYKEGKLEEAGKRLFDNNPLSAICGIVCAHEEQCAGNCIVGIKGEPVKFYEIEQEVSRAYLEQVRFAKPPSNGKRVAVIGSGPAGLAVAFEMASAGFQVTIFEDNAQLGGILRYGIPDYRLPRDLIDLLEQHLLDLGVKIRFNTM
ncbi:MAG: NAD(P)-binding protein, partial [Erysipelotrichaceae bacterium]